MNILQCMNTTVVLFVLAALGLGSSAHGAGYLLDLKQEGSNVIVSFAGQLQSASQAEGPYMNVLGATSPFVWPVLDGARQYWRAATAGGGTFSAGCEFTVALKSDGSLASWGWNDAGQLGAPGPGDWISVACGASHTVALKADGTLWAWGDNVFGQLGNGTYEGANHPVRVGSDTDWQVVACGGFEPWTEDPLVGFTVAIKTDGTLWGWGSGRGNGHSSDTNRPAQIGSDTNWAR